MEAKAATDVFHFIWIVMETAVEWDVDDEYGELLYLFDSCKKALKAMLPFTTNVQREQMRQWYREHRNEEWPGGVSNVDDVFQTLTSKRYLEITNR